MSSVRNVDRLRSEGGFLIKDPLPAAYEEVIEGLSPEEVDLLISVKQRFDDAQSRTPAEVAPYRVFVAPF